MYCVVCMLRLAMTGMMTMMMVIALAVVIINDDGGDVDVDVCCYDYPDANLETTEWTYDIPVQERIHEKVVEFDPEAIAKLQERVPMWREYLNTLAL